MHAATGHYAIRSAPQGRRSSDFLELEFEGRLLGMADVRIECTRVKNGVVFPGKLFATVRVYMTNRGEVVSTVSYGLSDPDAPDAGECAENPMHIGRHRSLTAALEWLTIVEEACGKSPLRTAMKLANRQVAASLPPVCGHGDAMGGMGSP